MPAGRPSKYKSAYCKKVDEYLSLNQDEAHRLIKSEGVQSTSYENKIKVNLPTVEGFCTFIGVPKETAYRWRDRHEDFRCSLAKVVKEQKRRLLENGLSGDYNPTIAKLILSSNHGMSEKTEVDVNIKDIAGSLASGRARIKKLKGNK